MNSREKQERCDPGGDDKPRGKERRVGTLRVFKPIQRKPSGVEVV